MCLNTNTHLQVIQTQQLFSSNQWLMRSTWYKLKQSQVVKQHHKSFSIALYLFHRPVSCVNSLYRNAIESEEATAQKNASLPKKFIIQRSCRS